MVSQTYGHHGDKRHNRAFSPYVGSSGYAETRVYIPPPPDSRTLMSEHRADRSEAAPTRRRIAVACGRCRQRKIRCSGDVGQNIPCSNCKNAGVTQCLFLRVSSRETAIKGDISLSNLGGLGGLGSLSSLRNEFNYNPVIARALATRSTVPPSIYSVSTNTSPTSTASPGASGSDFEYRAPLYPYKPYLSNMAPWSAGYGEDCVDYTIPTCSPYSVVSVSDAAHSPVQAPGSTGSTTPGPLMAYQPWDSRGKQAAVHADTPSPTMPSGSNLLSSGMPPPLASPKPAVSVPAMPGLASGGSGTSTAATSAANTSTTNLVYRLASTDDSSDYRHASSPLPLEGDLPRNSIEGIDRLPAEPLGSMSRYKVGELIARSAAPSPAPIPHALPHAVSHVSHASVSHSVHHSIPHSVPSPLPHIPHSVPHSVPHSLCHPMPPPMASPMPPPSPYTGHMSTASNDRVTSLGYPALARSSPVDHAAHSTPQSSTIPDGGIFSEQERSVGTQGTAGGPSGSGSCLDSYTYEPSPKPAGLTTVSMVRQKSKKTMTPAASTEDLAKAALTPVARVYSPVEGPPMSRSSSPALYMPPHHEGRSESVYVPGPGHALQQVQHTPSSRV